MVYDELLLQHPATPNPSAIHFYFLSHLRCIFQFSAFRFSSGCEQILLRSLLHYVICIHINATRSLLPSTHHYSLLSPYLAEENSLHCNRIRPPISFFSLYDVVRVFAPRAPTASSLLFYYAIIAFSMVFLRCLIFHDYRSSGVY